MKRTIAYLTGALALLIVTASAASALVYATTHWSETLHTLASGVLQGAGMAVGGLVGSFLVMRFQAARGFLKTLVADVASGSVKKVIRDLKEGANG